jgi:hypothetical protein
MLACELLLLFSVPCVVAWDWQYLKVTVCGSQWRWQASWFALKCVYFHCVHDSVYPVWPL